MNELFRLVLWVIVLAITLIGFFLVLGVLFPTQLGKTRTALQSMPGRAFLLGLVNFAFFGLIDFFLFFLTDAGAGRVTGVLRGILFFPALIILALLAITLSMGLTSMSKLLGERILPDLSSLKQAIWGCVFLVLACAVPFVGWFLLLPYIGLMSIGAFLLSLFQRTTTTQ